MPEQNPVSGKPRRLKRTFPDEPAAYVGLGPLLNKAAGDRFPERKATLSQVY